MTGCENCGGDNDEDTVETSRDAFACMCINTCCYVCTFVRAITRASERENGFRI